MEMSRGIKWDHDVFHGIMHGIKVYTRDISRGIKNGKTYSGSSDGIKTDAKGCCSGITPTACSSEDYVLSFVWGVSQYSSPG